MIIRRLAFCVVVFAALSLVFLTPREAAAFSGTGDGLDEGTAYLITNCQQLQEIKNEPSAWYRLANDIDCSATPGWNSGAGFEPIGTDSNPFNGVLRGDNHTVTGLTINRPTTDYVGLFGYMSSAGSVDRLRIKATSIIGHNCVGGIAGQTVSADVFNIGVYGEVTGVYAVGGAVGCNMGLIMNVHSHVDIGGSPTAAGGLVGFNDTFITRNYSTGFVPNDPSNGGLVGVISDTTVDNSFWDIETSGQALSASGTGLTSAQLKDWDYVSGLNNGGSFWAINPLLNKGYPFLTDQTPAVPDTFITTSQDNSAYDPTPTFEPMSNVESSTFECQIDNGVYSPCSSPYTPSPLADGEHTISVRATNSDGVTDQTPAIVLWSVNAAWVDSDGDGLADVIENAGPNSGDANNDGMPDSEQANVYSAPNIFVNNAYQALETNCTSISNILTGDPQYEDDPGYTYPMGLNDFQVVCPNAGMSARIIMYNYGVTYSPSYVLRKEEFVAGHNQYQTIEGYQLSNTTIGGESVTKVEYDLVDGGPLDLDGVADGNLYDPAGLALPVGVGATLASENKTPELAGTGEGSGVLLALGTLGVLSPVLLVISSRKRMTRLNIGHGD